MELLGCYEVTPDGCWRGSLEANPDVSVCGCTQDETRDRLAAAASEIYGAEVEIIDGEVFQVSAPATTTEKPWRWLYFGTGLLLAIALWRASTPVDAGYTSPFELGPCGSLILPPDDAGVELGCEDELDGRRAFANDAVYMGALGVVYEIGSVVRRRSPPT